MLGSVECTTIFVPVPDKVDLIVGWHFRRDSFTNFHFRTWRTARQAGRRVERSRLRARTWSAARR